METISGTSLHDPGNIGDHEGLKYQTHGVRKRQGCSSRWNATTSARRFISVVGGQLNADFPAGQSAIPSNRNIVRSVYTMYILYISGHGCYRRGWRKERERERERVECRDGGYDRTTREKGETKRVAVTRAMTRFQSASNARSRGPRPSLTQLTFGHAVYFKRITRPSLRNPLPSWPLSRHQLASSQFQAKLSFSSRSIRSIDPENTRHAIGDGLRYRECCFV